MSQVKLVKLVVSSGKGGVGKSMVASSLAMLFAKKKNIVAIDCDVDAPNLAIWLGELGRLELKIKDLKSASKTRRGYRSFEISVSAGPVIDYKKCNGCGLCVENCRFSALGMRNGKLFLQKFVCEGCGACEVICPQKAIKLKPIKNAKIVIKKTKYGFPLVWAQLFPGETGSGKIVSEERKEGDKLFSQVQILDSSPGTGCPLIASLRGTDFAVLVTEPTPSAFSDLKRVLEVVRYFNIPWFLVINKWDINRPLSKKIKNWSGKNFLGMISYDKRIFRAVSNFTPILETSLPAKKEIEAIYLNLLRLIEQRV